MKPAAPLWPAVLAAVLTLGGCASVEGVDFADWFSPAIRRGEKVARIYCAQCHALGSSRDSRNLMAPPFSVIRLRYNELSLKRELEVLPQAGHYLMPPTRIDPGDMDDLVTYIESLKSS